MPQSNTIFFFLFAAFVVYVTQRGELPKYMGFIFASPAPAQNTETPVAGPGNVSTSPLPDLSKVASVAETAAMFA